MHRPDTRVRTANGTLVVGEQEIRVERGPLRQCVRSLPRDSITQIRLTSRFHFLPVLIGGLLLALAGTLTLLGTRLALGPVSLLAAAHYSLILVLLLSGLFCLLALPLAWRAELTLANGEKTIRVRTGYHRRHRLEQAYTRIHQAPRTPQDLVSPSAVNTPSGSHPESG